MRRPALSRSPAPDYKKNRLTLPLAPLYLEYGVALMCHCRERYAGLQGSPDEQQGSSSEARAPKRAKKEAEADPCAACGLTTADAEASTVLVCDYCSRFVHLSCSGLEEAGPEEEAFLCPACATASAEIGEDSELAWQNMDQAAAIYEAAAEADPEDEAVRRALVRCYTVKGDLESDRQNFAEAVVEYARVVEAFDKSEPADLEDEERLLTALYGTARVYMDHFEACEGDDLAVLVGEDTEEQVVIAKAADRLAAARDFLRQAEARINAVLTRLAKEGGSQGDDVKRAAAGIGCELVELKQRLAKLEEDAAARGDAEA